MDSVLRVAAPKPLALTMVCRGKGANVLESREEGRDTTIVKGGVFGAATHHFARSYVCPAPLQLFLSPPDSGRITPGPRRRLRPESFAGCAFR
jgi:hypothetical protein